MPLVIPKQLAFFCTKTPERSAWLTALPERLGELQARWSLSLEAPFEHAYVSCSWVAPATRADGTRAVLKLGMPHMESEQEIAGLRFWNGDAAVRLLEADESMNSMLLERCEPGTPLFSEPESRQDVVIAGLLRRLWRKPPAKRFRPLSALMAYWRKETLEAEHLWPDKVLVRTGLQLMAELAADAKDEVLLAADLHAGNVLAAQREPWLMIDPKPFAGDRTYDATQHLFNCEQRLLTDPLGMIHRFADLLQVDADRVRLWTFARAAAEPRMDWSNWKLATAKRLA